MKKINWQYAIGEILIVIIGVSLAFSLSNWQENKSNHLLKKQYLESLILDIDKEVKILKANQESINSKMADIDTLIGSFPLERKTPMAMVGKLFSVAQLVSFFPEDVTYQTLVNSGDMRLLKDFELRKKIESHYNSHQAVIKNYERLENISKTYVGDFFIRNIDYEELGKGDTDFLNDPLLKNILISLRGAYMITITGNDLCIKSNEALAGEIKASSKLLQ